MPCDIRVSSPLHSLITQSDTRSGLVPCKPSWLSINFFSSCTVACISSGPVFLVTLVLAINSRFSCKDSLETTSSLLPVAARPSVIYHLPLVSLFPFTRQYNSFCSSLYKSTVPVSYFLAPSPCIRTKSFLGNLCFSRGLPPPLFLHLFHATSLLLLASLQFLLNQSLFSIFISTLDTCLSAPL